MRRKKNPTPKPLGFIPKQESLNSVRILFPSPTRSFDVKLSSEVFSTHHPDSIELPASTPLIPDVIHLTHPQNFLNKLHLAQSWVVLQVVNPVLFQVLFLVLPQVSIQVITKFCAKFYSKSWPKRIY